MSRLSVTALTDAQRPTGLWAASLLVALARDEAAGRRIHREPHRAAGGSAEAVPPPKAKAATRREKTADEEGEDA